MDQAPAAGPAAAPPARRPERARRPGSDRPACRRDAAIAPHRGLSRAAPSPEITLHGQRERHHQADTEHSGEQVSQRRALHELRRVGRNGSSPKVESRCKPAGGCEGAVWFCEDAAISSASFRIGKVRRAPLAPRRSGGENAERSEQQQQRDGDPESAQGLLRRVRFAAVGQARDPTCFARARDRRLAGRRPVRRQSTASATPAMARWPIIMAGTATLNV